MKKIMFLAVLLLGLVSLAQAAEVTLQWSAVADADGYKVYYGTESRMYGTPEDVVGNVTSYTPTLDPGTYYFALTAYNAYGESGYSEELGPVVIKTEAEISVPGIPATNETVTLQYQRADGKTVIVLINKDGTQISVTVE